MSSCPSSGAAAVGRCGTEPVPVPDVHFSFQSEQEVRITQSEFDRQAEITRLLLEGISSTHVSTQKVLRGKVSIRAL